jgi:cyclopropane fatty-acyl-phospholipid synthase-like methyltransferase
LPRGAFGSYFGLDLSALAIERARARVTAAGVTNCSFVAMDMKDWSGDEGVSAILMEECLYYLSPAEQEQLLRRCLASLEPDGSILVIVHDGERHARTLATCRSVCRVIDECHEGRVFLTLGRPAES